MAVAEVDYNLLRVFAALMRERSVTSAALRLGLTQASTSNALSRLRSALGDRLLERNGNAMVPTLRALALWDELQVPLEMLERSLQRAEFDPSIFQGQIRIGAADYVLELFGPRIAQALYAEAPRAKLSLLLSDPPADPEALFAGTLDVVIGPDWRLRPGLRHEALFQERFVGMAAASHPVLESPTLDSYLAFPHILVSSLGFVPGKVDAALRLGGRERVVALTTPYFASLPSLLEGTERVVSLGSRLAHAYAGRHALTTFELPLPVEAYAIVLAWHPRNETGPQHRWLRRIIRRACST